MTVGELRDCLKDVPDEAKFGLNPEWDGFELTPDTVHIVPPEETGTGEWWVDLFVRMKEELHPPKKFLVDISSTGEVSIREFAS